MLKISLVLVLVPLELTEFLRYDAQIGLVVTGRGLLSTGDNPY